MGRHAPPGEHVEWPHSEWSPDGTAPDPYRQRLKSPRHRRRRLGLGGGVTVVLALAASQGLSITGTAAASSATVTPASVRSAIPPARQMTLANHPAHLRGALAAIPVATVTRSTTSPATTAAREPQTSATASELPRATEAATPRSVSPGAALAAIVADANWIASAQLPDGALANYPFNGASAAIEPYLANYGAIGLAEATAATGDATYANDAWSWLDWYATHMEPATGYVTDYTYANRVETSTGTFDSTDAYAGTFLAAAWDTYAASGDTAQLFTLLPAIRLAVRAIESTQQPDGLTWATPTYHAKYLMDNAEVYGGLAAADKLAEAAGDDTLKAEVAADASRSLAGVQSLWNPTTASYDWARAGASTSSDTTTDWTVLYPDALEQIWAVGWGATTSAQATTILAQFLADQPDWDQPTASAPQRGPAEVSPAPVGYWPFASAAFLAAGDRDSETKAATSFQADVDAADGAWPWNSGTAGELILALAGTGPIAS